MNILELTKSAGITLEKVPLLKSEEHAGPCPLCGGTDRFRVWPREGDGGRWWCRRCGKGGDTIQFCRDVKGLGFFEACDFLGVEPGKNGQGKLGKGNHRGEQWTPRKAAFPCDKWQEQAGSFLTWAEEILAENKDVLKWLREERGLNETTVKAARIGWNPEDTFLEREAWGLPEVKNEQGAAKKLWNPAGLVIPFLHDTGVIRLKIRRPGKNEPRYVHMSGGSMATWALDGGPGSRFVIVESELDGLLLRQEAGDLSGVVILGSAQARPDIATTVRLNAAELVLVALDSDAAGAKQAWAFWKQYFPRAKRWPPIRGKDLTDSWKAGVPLRAWVEAGLEVKQMKKEWKALDRSIQGVPSRKDAGRDWKCLLRSTQALFQTKHKEGQADTESEEQDEETKGLLTWLDSIRLPGGPFEYKQGHTVIDGERFLFMLRKDIERGPQGPRARTGTLQEDIKALKRVVH